MGQAGWIVWMVVMALGSAPDVHALEVVDRTSYYDIAGQEADALARAMSQLGPVTATGRRAWAYTAWELDSQYGLKQDEGGCRVVEPIIRLAVETTFPRWAATAAASPALRVRWRAMVKALHRHEAIHRRHAVEAGRALSALLLKVPAQADCDAAGREAHRLLRSVVAQARRQSRAFDRDTDHGQRQGVRL